MYGLGFMFWLLLVLLVGGAALFVAKYSATRGRAPRVDGTDSRDG